MKDVQPVAAEIEIAIAGAEVADAVPAAVREATVVATPLAEADAEGGRIALVSSKKLGRARLQPCQPKPIKIWVFAPEGVAVNRKSGPQRCGPFLFAGCQKDKRLNRASGICRTPAIT